MKKPVIGISGSIMTDASGNFAGYKRAYVSHDYVQAVLSGGGIPVILPFSEDSDAIRSQLECVDALILSGGHDVFPQLYKEEPKQKLGDVFPARDRFDFELIEATMRQNKPIFGICRGMQILNVYFGGSLHQDLSYADRELLKHNQNTSPEQVTHTIQIMPGTKLHGILGVEELMVNSFHHQAVNLPGRDLICCAKAMDGVMEAFEHVSYPFLLSVQWHPEMLHASEIKMKELFSAFVKAAASSAKEA